jgi:hypothetical protein
MRERAPGESRLPPATAPVVLAFFSLTLLVFGPSTIYLTNVNEFSSRYTDVLLAGIALAAAFSLLLAAVILGLKALGKAFYEKGLALIFAAGFLIWLQGNFLLWDYGPLDGREIPWSRMARFGYIDGAVWLAVLAGAVVFFRLVIKNARKACLLLLILQLGYGAVLFSRNPETSNFKKFSIDARKEFLFSRQRNVVLIILDTFQTDFFDEVMRQSPDLAKGYEGFTRFRNALGGYPFTELSVVLMLTGRYYDNSMPYERWLKMAYLGNSVPRVLRSNGWRVDLFPKISYSVYYSDEVLSNSLPGVRFSDRVRDIAYILDLCLFRSLPHFLKRPVYNDQNWLIARLPGRFWKMGPKLRDDSPRLTLPPGRNRVRRRRLSSKTAYLKSQDVRFVEAMYAEGVAGDEPGAFKFYHLGGPHIPLILDENLNYGQMEVNRENYRKAATASLKLTALFLERLRQLGIYDQSLIIIVGDHGAGGQGQKFVPQPGMPGSGEEDDVVTLPYRINALPLMLVKPFGARGELKTSDAPVSVSDIPATVFASLGLTVDAPGEPVFSVDVGAPRERRYMYYSGRDVYSYYGDMTEYLVTGPGWVDRDWRPSGKVFTRGKVSAVKEKPRQR